MGLKTTKDSIDLGIITTNGPAMLAFYRDVLGLEHQGDMPMPTGGKMHRLLCGTSVIKIVVPEKAPANKPAPGGLAGGSGYRYWTISVSNLDQVVAAAQRAGRPIPIPTPPNPRRRRNRHDRRPRRKLGRVASVLTSRSAHSRGPERTRTTCR